MGSARTIKKYSLNGKQGRNEEEFDMVNLIAWNQKLFQVEWNIIRFKKKLK